MIKKQSNIDIIELNDEKMMNELQEDTHQNLKEKKMTKGCSLKDKNSKFMRCIMESTGKRFANEVRQLIEKKLTDDILKIIHEKQLGFIEY